LNPAGYGLLPVSQVETQRLAVFDCGKGHLNLFLTGTAGAMHDQRLGLTSVVFHAEVDGPVGFFTLSNDSIPLNTSESIDLGVDKELTLPSFPAVKIGRLAVSQALQGQGVGRDIINLILGEVLESASLSSARLLVVDADNEPDVVRFYEKQGFDRSLWAEKRAKHHGGKTIHTVKMHRDVLKP
jgi:GNAT superfamily N-acetyltransferase